MTILHDSLILLVRQGLALGMMCLGCACARPSTPIEVSFLPRYGDQAISCAAAAHGLQLTDLRLYVYELRLIDRAGRELPVQLPADGVWQDGTTALLDLEDGQGACVNGSAARNETLRGLVSGVPPEERYRGIRFTVGVPPDVNHGDPLLAGAPLNYTAMHWHWLSGYKFMRAGVAGPADYFWMHLGSNLCDGNIEDGIHCRAGNRVEVKLDDFDPATDRIVIDLERLTEGVDLEDGSGSDCSSGPDELTCGSVFANLGLAFGPAAAADSQRVFRSETLR